jgi:hypothetical protein
VALTFFCHKLLRWACPFLLIGMLAANIALAGDPMYLALLLGQAAFYGLSCLGHWIPTSPGLFRYFRLPMMFTAMNVALLFGFFRWVRGRQSGVWARTDRTGSSATSSTPELQPVGTE